MYIRGAAGRPVAAGGRLGGTRGRPGVAGGRPGDARGVPGGAPGRLGARRGRRAPMWTKSRPARFAKEDLATILVPKVTEGLLKVRVSAEKDFF